MPIDDVLGKIKTEQTVSKKYEQTCYSLLRNYVDVLGIEYIEQKEVKLNLSNFLEIKEYVKFTENCKLKVIPIPKSKIIELVNKNTINFKNLLKKTDLADKIPDKLVLDKIDLSNSILDGVDDILNYCNDWSVLEEFSQDTFIIPSMKFLSLFVKEGEKFRAYIKITGDVPVQILASYSEDKVYCTKNFTPFSVYSLNKFQEKTGITELKEMVEEVDELKDLIRKCFKGKLNIMDLRHKMFEKLNQHNPLLTYEEGK